jgi:4-alpha-glucanotransferase
MPHAVAPKFPSSTEIVHLARAAGIETAYRDYAGKTRDVSEDTLRAILELMGRGGDRENPPSSKILRRASEEERPLGPVLVAWNGRLPARSLPGRDNRSAKRTKLRLDLEGGEEVKPSSVLLEGVRIPLGYHHLHVETPRGHSHALVISAPRRSYSGSQARSADFQSAVSQISNLQSAGILTPPGNFERVAEWNSAIQRTKNLRCGVFAPLYALRSASDCGAGNFTHLAELGRWAAGQGSKVLATLPLMAGFLEGAFRDPSPYSPISRLFWNEFYIDVERLPEFAECAAAQRRFRSVEFQKRLRALRRSEWVEYAKGMRLRREILEILAAAANESEIQNFVRERSLVRKYAQFRAVCDQLDRPWHSWPERLRRGRIQSGDYAERDQHYHLYAQRVAQRQIEEMIGAFNELGLQLYLDLPVGVNRHGFDVWQNQDLFVSDANVGAPPDMFFNKGQNWNFPPLNPVALRRTQYRHVIEYLRFQMRHAGILRIDHVMGLHRLYWIPPGFSAMDGAYVHYQAEELHAIVCLESHRNSCEIVGENLGIVPEEVNRAMDEHRYRKMYVVQFEQRTGKKPLNTPPKNCVAMLETHDTPMFRAYWNGLDIPLRIKLRLLSRAEAKQERLKRRRLNRDAVRFLVKRGFLKRGRARLSEVMRALLAWLGRSGAGMTLVSLEDLWGETRPQNVPGTCREYRNWRRKTVVGLEEISSWQKKAAKGQKKKLRTAAAIEKGDGREKEQGGG